MFSSKNLILQDMKTYYKSWLFNPQPAEAQLEASQEIIYTIWLIPQGTVDNNLGPDRLEDPKALDPNYCRQPTLWLHDLCLEVQT